MKLENLDDNKYELYNFDSKVAYWGTDVAYVFFVRLFILYMPQFNSSDGVWLWPLSLTFN
jgi:hypothetical protein